MEEQDVESLGRTERCTLQLPRPPRRRKIPGFRVARSRDRHGLRLSPPAPRAGSCLRLHAVAARRRTARVRLPNRPILGELLRPPRQRCPRAAPTAQYARQDPRSGPAVAEPRTLHGGRYGDRARDGKEPVANRDHGLVKLVPFVSDRKELPALARYRGGPPSVRR